MPPPFPPDRKRDIYVANTIRVFLLISLGYIFLKPWDGQSILDIPPMDIFSTELKVEGEEKKPE